MDYQVIISQKAEKILSKLSKVTQDRIRKTLRELVRNPRPPGCKKMEGSEFYRVRAGDYRVIYDIQDRILTVMVVKIGHRKEVYR